mmetsp:Transcript_26644/g.30608  ORF Transcript_26644/g.30608 Transcript_26644/m.30608 type:complete len:123 (-) Transcript_26644:481-849(-)
MATKDQKGKGEGEEQTFHKVRMTFTSREVKSLESACTKIIQNAKDRELKVSGPVRMPTKHLNITTRKAPNGEGTNTWDRFEMKIHKRVIDLTSPSDKIKEVTSIAIDPCVNVELIITDSQDA